MSETLQRTQWSRKENVSKWEYKVTNKQSTSTFTRVEINISFSFLWSLLGRTFTKHTLQQKHGTHKHAHTKTYATTHVTRSHIATARKHTHSTQTRCFSSRFFRLRKFAAHARTHTHYTSHYPTHNTNTNTHTNVRNHSYHKITTCHSKKTHTSTTQKGPFSGRFFVHQKFTHTHTHTNVRNHSCHKITCCHGNKTHKHTHTQYTTHHTTHYTIHYTYKHIRNHSCHKITYCHSKKTHTSSTQTGPFSGRFLVHRKFAAQNPVRAKKSLCVSHFILRGIIFAPLTINLRSKEEEKKKMKLFEYRLVESTMVYLINAKTYPRMQKITNHHLKGVCGKTHSHARDKKVVLLLYPY